MTLMIVKQDGVEIPERRALPREIVHQLHGYLRDKGDSPAFVIVGWVTAIQLELEVRSGRASDFLQLSDGGVLRCPSVEGVQMVTDPRTEEGISIAGSWRCEHHRVLRARLRTMLALRRNCEGFESPDADGLAIINDPENPNAP